MQIFVEIYISNEPVHEIFNNVACATSKASDQPAHMSKCHIVGNLMPWLKYAKTNGHTT